MQCVPSANFEPALQVRLEELWRKPVNIYRALGNHPALVAAWTEFANAIRHESRTPRALRESQIAAPAAWRDSPEFDAGERAALALAEAVADCKVTDAVYAEVSRHVDHAQYVELSLTAGFYAMVVRMLDALRVDLDADVRDYAPKLP